MTYQRISITPDLLEEEPKAAQVAPPQARTEPRHPQAPQSTREADIERLVSQLEANRTDLTTNYADWVKLGFSFADLGESGRDYFHRISSIYSGYDRTECDKQFNTCLQTYDGSTRIESFFQYCKEAGQELRNPQSQVNGNVVAKQVQHLPPQQPTESKELTQEEINTRLQEASIDFSEELAPPPVCLEVQQNGTSAIIGTRGNFSMIIGKAKSRKTFFLTIALAAAICNDNVLGLFKGSLPDSNSIVLYFDTEQGRYHVQKSARRVLHLSNNPAPSNFKAYGLRKFKPHERLQIIEQAIVSTPNLGMVVIDGVRDLVSSINDEELATMLASKLLKWTEEQEIHIMCVLHQNKGDNNARGHLGTELQNKAETVLSITKDAQNKDISIVEAEYCREKEFEAFAFGIDEYGVPVLIDNWVQASASNKSAGSNKFIPKDWPFDRHYEVLQLAFSREPKPRYSQLLSLIKLALQEHDVRVGDNRVKDFITWYLNEQLITKQGNSNSKNSFYTLIPVV